MPILGSSPPYELAACFFEDFKSYRSATLPLRPLTLLIGANASGKSNLLEGIRFLSLLSQGRRIDEVWRVTHDTDIAIRGARPEALFRAGASLLTLGCELRRKDGKGASLAFSSTIGFATDPVGGAGLRVHREMLAEGERWLYRVSQPAERSVGITVEYNNFSRGGKKPRLTLSNDQALFVQLQGPQVFSARHWESQQDIPAAARGLRDLLSNIQFLDPVPSAMRGGSFPSDDRLREDGRNVSAVLANLCSSPDRKRQVLEFVRSLPEQDIRDIAFVKGARGDVLVVLEESFGGRSQLYDATQLSDGTLRALAIIAALLSVPKGTLLVVEEIDNGLHPSRAKHLLSHIDQLARARGHRVLITTHNPALVDAVPLSAVPDIVLCYRDAKEGDSRLIRLDELPDYPALIGQHSIGELMTSGQLELATKWMAETPASRQAQASSFVEQFLAEVAARDASVSPADGADSGAGAKKKSEP